MKPEHDFRQSQFPVTHRPPREAAGPSPEHVPALPPEAVEAIRRGRTIEAIKITREHTGLGLKEAKDWVESFAAAHPNLLKTSPSTAPAGNAPPPEALAAVRAGNLLEAIKLTRQHTGVDLKTAKDMLTAQIAADPELRRQVASLGNKGRAGCLVVMLIVGAVVAALLLGF